MDLYVNLHDGSVEVILYVMKRFFLLCMLLLLLMPCTALGESMEAVPRDDIVWAEDGTAVMNADALTEGCSGEEVLALQRRLAELSYYDGELSGSFGPATRNAVAAFQADFELESTGMADAQTQSILFSTTYRPLRYGSRGELVKNLQTRLMALGLYTGKISGNYLASTQAAVEKFQRKNGLAPTGEADLDTQEALYSVNARGNNDKALPTVTIVPPDEAEDFILLDDHMTTPAPTIAFSKTLKYGVTDKSVTPLQERLTELGFYEGPVSGNYLGHTRNAIEAFQKHNALEADGVTGEMTWNALFNDPDVRAASDAPKPTPAPTPVPFAITVDVNNQVTTVYGRDENGDYSVVVRQMLCSTGTKGYPSDVGDWVLSGRTARWCDFPKWGGHAQFWTKINGSIAFHSVIYNSYDTMDLSIKSYNNLGKRASHGCIRLTVADAKWIYYNCGAGTVVTITEDLPADPELRASLKLPALNKSNMLPYVTAQPTASPVYVSGAQPPLPLQQLKKNSSSEAVFWLQSKLAELGYYKGKITGTYLDGTVNAVKAFQKDHGLSANGTANVATLKKLYEQELATPTPAPTATPTPPVRDISLPEAGQAP